MPRRLMLTAPRTLEFVEVDAPPLGQGEVRVRSLLSGISHGTEMNLYRGTSPFADKRFDGELRAFVPAESGTGGPAGLGYEMVGEVVEVGPGVDGIVVGDRVHTSAGHGEESIARIGNRTEGYPTVRLPTDQPPERGLFLSLGCVALLAIHDAHIKVGDTVVVSGAGVIGQLTAQLARLSGADRVLVVDPHPARRALASELAAADPIDPDAEEGTGIAVRRVLDNAGADVAIETSGVYAGLQGAIAAVGMGARLVAAGYYQGGGADLRLGEEWHHNRPTMVSSMGAWDCPHRDYPQWDRMRLMETVRRLVYDGRLVVDPLLTEVVAFDRAPEAYARLDADHGAALKIALRYGEHA